METAKTLRETLAYEGVGLHTGERCKILLHPADFVGEDADAIRSPFVASAPSPTVLVPCQILIRRGNHTFRARWDYVLDTARATALGDGGVKVSTVEHLMAALWMTGITHCVIEVVQGNEIPILDGSALPFVEAIRSTDTPVRAEVCPDKNLQTTGTEMRLDKIVQATGGDRYLALSLSGDTLFGYIQFPEPLGVQAGAFSVADALSEIAPARTFGFLREVQALRQQGLALGGALENALVIDETGYHNPARFEDEPLRHKLLDVLGDLYLSGVYLPRFTLAAVKPGHALNVQLARALAQRFLTED